MKKQTDGKKATRRDFLKIAAAAAPAAAATAALAPASAHASPVDPTSETMQDTLHTRAYYDSTRF